MLPKSIFICLFLTAFQTTLIDAGRVRDFFGYKKQQLPVAVTGSTTPAPQLFRFYDEPSDDYISRQNKYQQNNDHDEEYVGIDPNINHNVGYKTSAKASSFTLSSPSPLKRHLNPFFRRNKEVTEILDSQPQVGTIVEAESDVPAAVVRDPRAHMNQLEKVTEAFAFERIRRNQRSRQRQWLLKQFSREVGTPFEPLQSAVGYKDVNDNVINEEPRYEIYGLEPPQYPATFEKQPLDLSNGMFSFKAIQLRNVLLRDNPNIPAAEIRLRQELALRRDYDNQEKVLQEKVQEFLVYKQLVKQARERWPKRALKYRFNAQQASEAEFQKYLQLKFETDVLTHRERWPKTVWRMHELLSGFPGDERYI